MKPFATYENQPWYFTNPVNFLATIPSRFVAGKAIFDTQGVVEMLPSARASLGSVFLFDTWSFSTNMTDDDFYKSIQNGVGFNVLTERAGNPLFLNPLTNLRPNIEHNCRMAWVPTGEPATLFAQAQLVLGGVALLDYPSPSIRLSLTAYEVRDKAYIDALLRGWKDVRDQEDPLVGSTREGGARLMYGSTSLREYQA